MTTIFNIDDHSGDACKMNLDELYETKQQRDLNTVSLYNKILNRIHSKIKVASNQRVIEQHCWFVIPEMVIGIPKYNSSECTIYIIDKLKDNGFMVSYTNPNLLLISWKHWVPKYVRTELKKKTGVVVDGYGNNIEPHNSKNQAEPPLEHQVTYNPSDNTTKNKKSDSLFKKIETYKPSGTIYNELILKKSDT
jgi:Family of unknown function (DUF5759)